MDRITHLIFRAVASAAALFCFIVLVIVGWMFWGRLVDDTRYAAAYFDGLVSYERVLESRYWGRSGWSCTFAIVQVPMGLPTGPATRDKAERGWQYAWGGDWRPTPAPELGNTTRDAIGSCAGEWQGGLAQKLQVALEAPGGFYQRDSVGETVMIYAPKQRLAARIRYGD